jgi:hypothetical protein
MKVLVACEYSGRVREAFRKSGHDAFSCDLLPADDNSKYHYQGDVLDIINDGWDLLISHPPCTYLTCSAEWAYKEPSEISNKRLDPGKLYGSKRKLARGEAERFFLTFAEAPIERIAIENPVGVMSTRFRKPDQIIQPYQFGEDASKSTCLWLKNLPVLVSTKRFQGRVVEWPRGSGKFVERWSNQTDSGQSNLPVSDDRWKLRSYTYQGIANAMAAQWGV